MKRLLLLFAWCAMFFIACQPVPETEFVINKGDDTLEKALTADSVPAQQPVFPAHVKNRKTLSEKMDLCIDANLFLPEKTVFPVYKIRLKTLSSELVESLLKRVTSDGYISTVSCRTKEGILETVKEIENAKRNIIYDNDIQPNERDDFLARYDEMIDELMQEYETAPEAPVPANSIPSLNQTQVFLYSESGSQIGTAYFQLHGKSKDAARGSMIIVDVDLNDRALSYYPDVRFDSIDTAESFCVQLLKDVGIKDYELNESFENDLYYILHFVKSYSGIPYTPTRRYDGAAYDGENYFEYIPDESIAIVLGKGTSCIRAFDWYAPSEIESCIHPNVEILPFEKIQEIFEKHCKAVTTWNPLYSEGVIRQEVLIDDIRLGYKRIPQKNNPEEYMVVPAWAFSGTLRLTCDANSFPFETLDQNNQTTVTLGLDGLCAVMNAIDGSMIYSGIREE